MKKLFLSFLIFTAIKIEAVEYEKKVTCSEDGVCTTEDRFKGLTGRELRVEDLRVDMCLFDPVGKGVFYRVEKVESVYKKVVLNKELNENDYTVEVERKTVYTDSREWNTKMRPVECKVIDGYILNEEARYKKCITDNPTRALKIFCQKERRTNF